MRLIDTTPKPVEKTYTLEGLTEYDLAYIQYCIDYAAGRDDRGAASRFSNFVGINPKYCPEKAFIK